MRILVTGGGGFIGSHLTHRLKEEGHWVRAVDLKHPQWSESPADEFQVLDLRDMSNALRATDGMDWVFALAANMGGIGFISGPYDAEIVRDNTMINVNTIEAAHQQGVKRYFFSSSACVYPRILQDQDCSRPLKEADVYPADCGTGYGWEKLHGEHLCHYYQVAGWLDTRVARFHNCYGPRCAWEGGREKAPAALCRKVAVAKLTGNPVVEIWGDGQQRRSYMYVADCVEGVLRLMESDFQKPLNIGLDDVVTVDELVDVIAEVAGTKIVKKHIRGFEGVRFRNSDNSLCREVLEWEPSIPLEEGLIPTYQWIEEQVRKCLT